jgi:hypothetical protein
MHQDFNSNMGDKISIIVIVLLLDTLRNKGEICFGRKILCREFDINIKNIKYCIYI